ncbi:OB-fold domain-containing protein [Aquincola sp. S2]|uniref:OB-fold domain-containing protein n=1 Tax=Pseudaquabacterium terrae TaxID=2732868 RepID=A0ABX2EUF9_9BURK|nr:OB-fold domain-containing protein [Aquabacterium terrae]NRF72392.1 OB-fold domain-containing protein [Aquabacterium terrae]
METLLHPESQFRQHLEAGRFMLLQSRASGAFIHPPRIAAPGSGATDLHWVPASGRGTVYSSTTVRCKPPALDYNVALIELAEGPRMMSTVTGIAPAQVRIGMAVVAQIDAGDEGPRVVFVPAN